MSKVQVKGIFVGAKVVRGPDWDWGNQVFKNIFTGVSYIKTELENNLNKYPNIFNSLAFIVMNWMHDNLISCCNCSYIYTIYIYCKPRMVEKGKLAES